MNQVVHPYFRLQGEFDPDEITRLLEIEPSWVERIGDPGPPDGLDSRLGAVWTWQPEDDDSDNVSDQLAYLVGTLYEKHEQVSDLSARFWGTFYVFNEVGRTNRTWFLSAELLRMIANLRVNIECVDIRSIQDDEVSNDAN